MSDIQTFKAKNRYMDAVYKRVSAKELYRDIFPLDTLEKKGDKSHRASNPIFTVTETITTAEGKTRRYFRNVIGFADTFIDDLKLTQKNPCALCSCISYSGRRKTAKNAFKCHGFIIDLDGVGMKELESFWGWVEVLKEIPHPTYVINSGHGLHIYYIFQNPVPLYPNVVHHLQTLKKGLTLKVWNYETSDYKPQDRQFQGIYQSFRMVGSCTKLDKKGAKQKYLVTGWKTGERWSIADLNSYVYPEYKAPTEPDYASWEWADEGHLSLSECKELYPDWYERRIVQGLPANQWVCNRGLYDWWLKTIKTNGNAVDGNRYFCIAFLYVYGLKCGIPKEEVDKDAYALVEPFNRLTASPDNAFTADDVKAASEYYDPKYVRTSKKFVKMVTRIDIPTQKHNGQPQAWHLEDIRMKKVLMKRRGQDFKNPEGRPDKKNQVIEWRKTHPLGKKVDCVRETGLSKPTVLKWWDAE